MRNKSKPVALAGMLSALAVVFLLLGAMVELLDLSAATMAALVVMVAIIELGKGWACGVYAVSALISLLLFPMSTATVTFALFIGYYPILKVFLDRIRPPTLQYLVKLLCFTAFFCLAFWLVRSLIGVASESEGMFVTLCMICEVTFLVFDYALGLLAVVYIKKVKNRFRK